MDLDTEVVCLEDLRERVTLGVKISAALQAFLLPTIVLSKMLGLYQIQSEDPVTVIFTSGSTGDPKGVVLTQKKHFAQR